MVEVLPDGVPLETMRAGEYVVSNPDTGLDPATYLVTVLCMRTGGDAPFNLQIAQRMDTGAEYFRANISTDSAEWTAWQARSGSVSDITAAAIVEKLDSYLAGSAWRTQTDLTITNRGADSLDIESSTGDDVTLPSAEPGQAGLMSAADYAMLGDLALYPSEPLVLSYPASAPVTRSRIVVVDSDKARHLNPADAADAVRTIGKALNTADTDEIVHVRILALSEE